MAVDHKSPPPNRSWKTSRLGVLAAIVCLGLGIALAVMGPSQDEIARNLGRLLGTFGLWWGVLALIAWGLVQLRRFTMPAAAALALVITTVQIGNTGRFRASVAEIQDQVTDAATAQEALEVIRDLEGSTGVEVFLQTALARAEAIAAEVAEQHPVMHEIPPILQTSPEQAIADAARDLSIDALRDLREQVRGFGPARIEAHDAETALLRDMAQTLPALARESGIPSNEASSFADHFVDGMMGARGRLLEIHQAEAVYADRLADVLDLLIEQAGGWTVADDDVVFADPGEAERYSQSLASARAAAVTADELYREAETGWRQP